MLSALASLFAEISPCNSIERRVLARFRDAVAGEIEHAPRDQRDHAEKHEAKEDAPAPRGALLADGGERDAFERVALPIVVAARRNVVGHALWM